jgi:hypothetical protein
MRATLVYMTGRRDPRLDWTLRSLDAQATSDDDLELIIVDALGRNPADIGLVPCAAVTSVIATRPKPCVWQGPQRVTSRDWWATANARNTAIALASRDYVVFCDDRCWLGPEWLAQIRRGACERASVLVGSYEKLEDHRVTMDHRRQRYPEGLPNCGGGWLFGCTFALPLEWLLEVNGLEEGCDGLTGEDYILGLMLGNRGRRIDFEPRMFVRQERSMGTEHGYAMTDKGCAPADKSHAALDRFGKRDRTEMTPDLRELRRRITAGEGFPDVDHGVDYRDWYDGQPIRDMTPPA